MAVALLFVDGTEEAVADVGEALMLGDTDGDADGEPDETDVLGLGEAGLVADADAAVVALLAEALAPEVESELHPAAAASRMTLGTAIQVRRIRSVPYARQTRPACRARKRLRPVQQPGQSRRTRGRHQ